MIPSTLAGEIHNALADFLATGFGPSNRAFGSVMDDFLAVEDNLAKGPPPVDRPAVPAGTRGRRTVSGPAAGLGALSAPANGLRPPRSRAIHRRRHRHGPDPHLVHFADCDEQASWIIRYLTDLGDRDEPLRGACVVARTRAERDAIAGALKGAGLPVEVLEADSPDQTSTGVRLATMHRVKGLEFDRVVIASVNQGIVPLPAAAYAVDRPERTSAETAERALLYVAGTRAKKELAVLSFGERSPFLD